MNCPSCGGHQPEGLLCHDDTAALETMLAAVPQLIDQLNVAVSKQAKISTGGKAGKGSAHTKMPVNWGVAGVRDSLLIELARWDLTDIRLVRRHPQAAEILSGIGHAIKRSYSAIDRMRDRKYLGRCMNKLLAGECQEELWVAPGARTVRCKACTYEHNVTNRREDMLDLAEDMIVTPREASQYIGEVGGIKVGHQRIRNYLDRKRIAVRPSPDGVQRLRLGDLLDVLRDDTARHEVRAS